VYRLTFQGQTTIRPTQLVVDVEVPAGTSIVRTNPPMRTSERRAVWRGVAVPNMTFEVEFQKPFVPRAWDALWSFLNKRVVTL
jgi:hypothetical protein